MTQDREPDEYLSQSSRGGRFTTNKEAVPECTEARRSQTGQDSRPAGLLGLPRMNENGVDAYTIMKIGGWPSLAVLERYLRRNQKHFILAVQSLDTDGGLHKGGNPEGLLKSNSKATLPFG